MNKRFASRLLIPAIFLFPILSYLPSPSSSAQTQDAVTLQVGSTLTMGSPMHGLTLTFTVLNNTGGIAHVEPPSFPASPLFIVKPDGQTVRYAATVLRNRPLPDIKPGEIVYYHVGIYSIFKELGLTEEGTYRIWCDALPEDTQTHVRSNDTLVMIDSKI